MLFRSMYLTDEVVIHVLSETSPTVLWSKLEELYMAKSLTNTLFLWRQFYQLRMAEEQSVQEHLNYFQKILTDLFSIGENVEEKNQGAGFAGVAFSFGRVLDDCSSSEKEYHQDGRGHHGDSLEQSSQKGEPSFELR